MHKKSRKANLSLASRDFLRLFWLEDNTSYNSSSGT